MIFSFNTKKWLSFFAFNALLYFGLWQTQSLDVTIPDPNLEIAFREVLNKPTGAITDVDLASLTAFSPGGREISNLEGLEYCINLQTLNLSNNYINNISSLSGLVKLRELYLTYNHITNVSPLSALSDLEVLYLNSNQIEDIVSLLNLTRLRVLELRGNQIIGINSLSDLTNMRGLYLSNNKIENIDSLSSLNKLTSLALDNNRIADITSLSNLNNLISLELSSNKIEDIDPLSGLNNLTALWLSTNKIINISSLSNLTNLRILYLRQNLVSDLKPIVDNTDFGLGDSISIVQNPLNNTSRDVYIPILQERGAIVYFDYIIPFTVDLFEGHNLVSIPFQITDNSIYAALRLIDSYYRAVWAYNSTSKEWEKFIPSDPDFLNNLMTIEPGKGYFIQMTVPNVLILYKKDNYTEPLSLKRGWNLVGYPSLTPRSVHDALIGMPKGTWIYGYNVGTWLLYTNGDQTFLNTLSQLEPGKGYYIYVEQDCIWNLSP